MPLIFRILSIVLQILGLFFVALALFVSCQIKSGGPFLSVILLIGIGLFCLGRWISGRGILPRINFGRIILVMGIFGLFFSLTMETSVPSATGNRIHNIGLLNERLIYLIISSLLTLIGTIITLWNRFQFRKPTKPCVFCAEDILLAASICRFCGKDQPAIKN